MPQPENPGVSRFWNILQTVVATAFIAGSAWAWNAEGRMRECESQADTAATAIATVSAKVEALEVAATDIRLIQQDIRFINAQLDEIKQLVKDQR